jgi:hypothetical protein
MKIDELARNKYKFDSRAFPEVVVADGTRGKEEDRSA